MDRSIAVEGNVAIDADAVEFLPSRSLLVAVVTSELDSEPFCTFNPTSVAGSKESFGLSEASRASSDRFAAVEVCGDAELKTESPFEVEGDSVVTVVGASLGFKLFKVVTSIESSRGSVVVTVGENSVLVGTESVRRYESRAKVVEDASMRVEEVVVSTLVRPLAPFPFSRVARSPTLPIVVGSELFSWLLVPVTLAKVVGDSALSVELEVAFGRVVRRALSSSSVGKVAGSVDNPSLSVSLREVTGKFGRSALSRSSVGTVAGSVGNPSLSVFDATRGSVSLLVT